ncbi:MAG: alkaline phosphatase [Betaproteobacteria bacterium]|nr:alkaline phosphatase [Betaproteobacteria bacterium]
MRDRNLTLILIRSARKALAAAVAGVALALAAGALIGAPAANAAQPPRNIIILFADGAAPTQWDFGRHSSKVLRGQPFVTTDIVFRQGTLGLLSTHPSNGYVTDSAAAGSAMSTGYKVNNGAVAITPDGKPVPTVMEVARARGKRIGLVTTATVYDATPAAFSLHAKLRWQYQALVDQYLALEPEVLMGGGADYFLPAGAPGGKRKDGKDVIAAFRAKGYQVVRNTAELNAATGAKVLGLFADTDMDFELDRDPARQPTTAEMTAAALKALSQSSPNGFVLLVENENIDTAGHANDAASLMRALWAFDDAVTVALDFQRHSPDTLLIVTGDHESGGFSPTEALRDLSKVSWENRFNPGEEQLRMLARITMSLNRVKEKLGRKPSGEVLDKLLAEHFPGFTLDPDLRELILRQQTREHNFTYLPHNHLGRMVARQTGYYWGTSGHTSQPVVVGAIGPGAELFHGYQDNTEFGKHLHRLILRD